jgi:glycosyltransferase involved in cell wall biosynthesis
MDKYSELERENFFKTYSMPIYYSFVGQDSFKNKFRWYYKFVKSIVPKTRFLLRLLKVIRQEKPDIIHTNVGIIHEGFWSARIMNIPHIWHLREYQDMDWGYWIYPTKRIFSKLLRKTNVITISNSVKMYFNLATYNFAYTIYNGICHRNEISFISKKDNYFLSASSLCENKGIKEIILAFTKFCLNHPEYKLYIVGDDQNAYAKELKHLVNDKGMSQHIIFSGYKQKDEVYKYMQSAKALVVASYNEAFGRMTAEAAFKGTLPIARNTAGTKEILDTIGGIPFEGDYHDLARKMEFVHSMSVEEYNKIVLNAQQIAQEKYSIESNVDEIQVLYNNLIK